MFSDARKQHATLIEWALDLYRADEISASGAAVFANRLQGLILPAFQLAGTVVEVNPLKRPYPHEFKTRQLKRLRVDVTALLRYATDARRSAAVKRQVHAQSDPPPIVRLGRYPVGAPVRLNEKLGIRVEPRSWTTGRRRQQATPGWASITTSTKAAVLLGLTFALANGAGTGLAVCKDPKCQKMFWRSHKNRYCRPTCENRHRKAEDRAGLRKNRKPAPRTT